VRTRKSWTVRTAHPTQVPTWKLTEYPSSGVLSTKGLNVKIPHGFLSIANSDDFAKSRFRHFEEHSDEKYLNYFRDFSLRSK
jgi:hypothetical protein